MSRTSEHRNTPTWRCDLVRLGSAWQLSLTGEIDLAALPDVRRAAAPVFADGGTGMHVCVDLCPMTFIDCAAAGWLSVFDAQVARRGGAAVFLLRPGSQVDDLLRKLGLQASLTVCEG